MKNRHRKFPTLFASVGLLLSSILLGTQLFAQDIVTQTTTMPLARAYHGSAVLGNYLYVVGGKVEDPAGSSNPDDTIVLVSRIAPNGQLSQWVPTKPLPHPRYQIMNSTVSINDTMYVVGGSNQVWEGDRYDTILWTRPMPNGDLQPWRESDPIPGANVALMTAVTTPGYLHIIGGSDNRSVVAG